ncbi:DNA-directed RNA polymerase sigma-70 factor [Dyadobacter beijingensis]|uniref:DNA-directed RNA polymerase sigma-70 factor n=1 Tax=Dyadobacter beijingensis TaxID=365489 RepID=A0ABQ2I0E6_9BACT|nr:RNA polymerase sigma-70 factor [Dyadobacter beijingensis]GGM94813.1 DNA-directed RNA polymerase sigma-70 factor [Dyadobacter beijingensis]
MSPEYSDHLPDDEQNLGKPAGPRGSGEGHMQPDKEFFIRKTFETDAEKGYELLFRTYYIPLCSHAARFVYNKEVAEDLVTEIFLNFWKKGLHTGITTTFRAYLFTAVRNRCFTYLRWEFQKIRQEELDDDFRSDMLAPDHMMEMDELYMQVEQVIHALPPQCRKVFILSRFEGKSYQEIAAKLEVSVKAVEGHISKALTVLRRSLKKS